MGAGAAFVACSRFAINLCSPLVSGEKCLKWIYHYAKCLSMLAHNSAECVWVKCERGLVKSYFRFFPHLLCDNDDENGSTWDWQFRSLHREKRHGDESFMMILELFNRNALEHFHKIRRHLNEPRASKPTNSIKLVMNRPTYSSSQLSIKVSELHADANGRLEISCMSTIPPKVGRGEMYADFKSYSIKSEFFLFFCFH